jgi:serine/threonine-protein kinase
VAEAESTPFVGQLLDGRYKIVREIASGGMSVVYEATHVKIGRTVAIKVLHRDMAGDPEVVARFLNEARAVGTFGHPNIVASTDFGELPGHVPYLVLEYLEGHTLSQEVKDEGPLPVRRVARIGLQIASALDAAHARNVIHRDLTSANIFLVKRSGNPDHVKVLDFGISKFLTAGDAAPKTRRGLTMGTPEFMAPEQISDPDSVDARVDVYALGVIMYHMLAGQYPFTRTPLQSLLTQIVVDPPPPIERQGIPEGLLAIVLKALAKNPADRFASMREMAVELERLSSRIFSGADLDAESALGYDSGSGSRPHLEPVTHTGPMWAAVPRSIPGTGPVSGPISGPNTGRVTGPISGPISAPQIGVGAPVSGAIVVGADPATAPRGRGLLFVSLALALGSFGGFAFLLVRGHGAEPAAPAPAPIAVAPAPAPLPPAPVEPAAVHVQISSPTAQARATLRGRTRLLPYAEDLKPGTQPEIVELTSPGHEGRRFWITFDHPIALAVDLPTGSGVVEATAEQTVIALGGKPVAGEAPAVDDAAGARRGPSGGGHHGSHRHAASALALAKATEAPEPHAPSEAPPEPNAAPTPAKPEPAAPAPKPAVAAEAPSPPKVHASAPAAPSAAAPRPAGMDPAKTTAFVKSRLTEVQRCYERGRMDEPDLKGRVTLKISIAESGGVTAASVDSSSLHSSSVETCIVNTVKGWKFPAPSGGPAIISYPFNFK